VKFLGYRNRDRLTTARLEQLVLSKANMRAPKMSSWRIVILGDRTALARTSKERKKRSSRTRGREGKNKSS
jgi:hypothetical protein